MNRNSKNLKILQMIVGTEAFHQIINQLQGESIYISSFSCYPSKQERDQALKDDFYKSGLLIPELCLKYQISECAVYKILEQV